MRRPGRRLKCADMCLFAIVLLLIWANLLITFSMFASDAMSSASVSDGSAASTTEPAPSDTPAPPKPTAAPTMDELLDAGEGTFTYSDSSYAFYDMDELLANTIRRKFWGPAIFPPEHPGENAPLLDIATLIANPYHGHRDEDPVEAYRRHNELFAQTGCNLLTVPFVPSQDAKCIAYLTNRDNWLGIRPIEPEYDSRTIKFELRFKPRGDNASSEMPLRVVMKTPQKLFPYEAFSEVGAYHADRVMRVNRIPPTGWVCVPITDLRAAVYKYGPSIHVRDPDHNNEKVNYTKWIDEDVFDFHRDDSEQSENQDEIGGECIGMSVQLRVADVGHLLDSAMRIPYTPHNEGWFKYLDTQNQFGKTGPTFRHETWAATILHIAELNMFDFILGNGDRSPNKNNFVVGGCDSSSECGNEKKERYYLRHPGPPTFVHLDQGMAFYGNPRRNPILASVSAYRKNHDANDTFCLFRTRFLNRVSLLHSPTDEDDKSVSWFETLMLQRLEPGLRPHITSHMLRLCHDRMTSLLNLVKRCVSRTTNPVARSFIFTP